MAEGVVEESASESKGKGPESRCSPQGHTPTPVSSIQAPPLVAQL